MKREVALWTEWAWSEDLLKSQAAELAFAHVVLEGIRARHPGRRGRRNLALREIHRDIHVTVRRLNYGGRRPQDLHPLRRKFLSELSSSRPSIHR